MKNLAKTFVLGVALILAASPIVAQKAKPTPKPSPKPKVHVKAPAKPAAKPLVVTGDRAKAEEFVKQGKAYWDKFEISNAVESYTKAIAFDPTYIEAFSARGTVNFLTRKYELAVADFDKVLANQSKNTKILYYRGFALREIATRIRDDEGDKKKAANVAQKALADFNKAIEIEPDNYAHYLGRAKLFLAFEFFKEAVLDFEKSISVKPNEGAYAFLGLTKFYMDDASAINDVNQAIKMAPSFPESYYIRALINQNEGKYKDAILDFDEAIKLSKSNEKYYNARGLLYFRLQDGHMAVADFTEAIKQKNDFAMAYYNRAFTYKKYPYSVSTDSNDNAIDKIRLQRKKMLEDLDAAIKYKPNFDAAYVERGLINSTDSRNTYTNQNPEMINRLNLAMADFEQAIKINPKNAEAYNGRASCNDYLGKKELALADYTKAVELDPELVTAYMGRMSIYCEMKKIDLSIADQNKIKALGYSAINVCNLGGK